VVLDRVSGLLTFAQKFADCFNRFIGRPNGVLSVYTPRTMLYFFSLIVALTALLVAPVQDPSSANSSPPDSIPAGQIVPSQVARYHPDQTYALYLPSDYSPWKKYPIVYAFDPGAHGEQPVERMKDAAERYGYILAGSNNSRNGSLKLQNDAAQAIFEDTHERFSLDDRRMYVAGFSGGARVASQIAQNCKCAAGVILSGAGFAVGTAPSSEALFAVFSTVGAFDFNYPEVTHLDAALEIAGSPHFLRYFEGPHEWAPPAVMDEALAWFRLVAMKRGTEPRDSDFVAARLDASKSRAQSFEQSGDVYAAWREYQQVISVFDQLADTSDLRQRAASLAANKVVRDGPRREEQAFEEQGWLTRGISAGLMELRQPGNDPVATFNYTDHKIIRLRGDAAHEKSPEKARVLRRAIAGVFVEAMEAGIDRLEAKDYSAARQYFKLSADADPDSAWAWSNLAVAATLANDRKSALDALSQAKAKTKDAASFASWLQQEPTFSALRDLPAFRELYHPPDSAQQHNLPIQTDIGRTYLDVVAAPQQTAAQPAVASESVKPPRTKDPKKESKPRILSWDPPNVDAHLQPKSPTPECPLATVLEQAGTRAIELVTNLQSFTAEERIEYRSLGNAYEQGYDAGAFDYTAAFDRSKKGFVVQENRTPEKGGHTFPGATQYVGLPEIAVMFLPNLQSIFEMKCEGATEWKGQAAWVVHFRQRTDRPSHLVTIGGYPAPLKGRAWIAQDSGEVMHMEIGLMRDIPEVKLKDWSLLVDYAPVRFRARGVQVWLPESATAYEDLAVRRTIISHEFSNFLLFSVQTNEVIGPVKKSPM
jgi:predicted esterase